MDKQATGRVEMGPQGPELILGRELNVSAHTAWKWLTRSELLNVWIGSWEGTPGPGRSITFTMSTDDAEDITDVLIDECEPDSLLELTLAQDTTVWRLTFELEPPNGPREVGCSLTLRMGLRPNDVLGDVGSGWELYLDRMIAAISAQPMPEWDEYYPAMEPFYASLELPPS